METYTKVNAKELKGSQKIPPFSLTPENYLKVEKLISKYPAGREASAVLPVLHVVQEQNGGWLSVPALEEVARLLKMPYIRVYEVATFYKMFYLAPTGKYVLQFCGTTPCWLNGASELKNACQKKLGIKEEKNTSDGLFTITEVECVGACIQGPALQINHDLFGGVTLEDLEGILEALAQGEDLHELCSRHQKAKGYICDSVEENNNSVKPKRKSPTRRKKEDLSREPKEC